MFHELIDHSEDLRRLVDEGYSLEIKQGYALVHDVPYVNEQQNVCIGTLVCPLTFQGCKTMQPNDHVMGFIGEQPCNYDGTPITAIIHPSSQRKDWGSGIVIDRLFSNKPKGIVTFDNFYDKFINYIRIIVAPVHLIDTNITAALFKPIIAPNDSTFEYCDSNTSRAGVGAIAEKLNGAKIGIVGLGGTGSYLLDFIAKTPVQEIHLYDEDKFHTHNAFRAPGAPHITELEHARYKTEYLANIYSHMKKGIVCHNALLGEGKMDNLLEMNFVFICIDSGSDKKAIIDALCSAGIPFIDAGIGMSIENGKLQGTVRLTTITTQNHDDINKHISFQDPEDDLYADNIQIAEINCLCAVLAIIKWKKMMGVYVDYEEKNSCVYVVGAGDIVNES